MQPSRVLAHMQGPRSNMGEPKANRLLAALEPDDFDQLAPYLETVDLPLGCILVEHGAPIERIYFPQTCIISVIAVLHDGAGPEMAIVGPDGMLGFLPYLTDREAYGRYVVQVPGRASRIGIDNLEPVLARRPQISQTFFCFLEAFLTQTLQSVACNAVHPVEARCCRWLLMTRDRLRRDDLPLTHEFLGAMLGVQRPTVSATTRLLQSAGLIEQRRGVITVLDPTGLREAACECYGHIRSRIERLLPRAYCD